MHQWGIVEDVCLTNAENVYLSNATHKHSICHSPFANVDFAGNLTICDIFLNFSLGTETRAAPIFLFFIQRIPRFFPLYPRVLLPVKICLEYIWFF